MPSDAPNSDAALDDLDPTVETTALVLRDPRVPVTIDQLAALRGQALEVLDARVLVLETARRKAIRMTYPPDWVLFKAPDGAVTGYLQDVGADRVRDVLGIEVFNVSAYERVTSADGASFVYLVTGDGRSRLTLQTVERMEGGRGSDDEHCKGKTGAALELAVRKAARANLDGGIVRELAGLRAVPIEEIGAAWEGTARRVEQCHKGRGFGSGDERHGATRAGVPDVEPPTCPVCPPVNGAPVKLAYRAGKDGRGAFYGCPNYTSHPNRKVTVDAERWLAQSRAAAPPASSSAPEAPPPTFARAPGADREPGAEG